ncbi:MAG: right-handed parallel beta-helix repeat-containing protein [Candidatus Hodarchaeota archaeon]
MKLKKFLFNLLLSLPKNKHHQQREKKLIINFSSKNSMHLTTKNFMVFLIVFFLGVCNSNILTPSSGATTWTVTSTADSGGGTLRNALLNAQANDTIIFDPATFPLSSPAIITLTSNPLPSLSQGNITLDGSNAGVILDGSSLGGWPDGIEISSDLNLVKGLEFFSFSGAGISINGGKFNVISNNSISYCGQGIEGSFSHNNTIINNTAFNNNYNGIWFGSSNNNTISNNTCYRNIDNGITVDGSNNNIILGNRVYNNWASIVLWGPAMYNDIIDNEAYNSIAESIGFHAANNNSIIGNQIYNNDAGIAFYEPSNYNIIKYNEVYNNSGICIGAGYDGGSHHNIYINNTLYDSLAGIHLIASSRNNILINNTAYDNSYAIIIEDSGNNSIVNNSMLNNGVYIGSSTLKDSLQGSVKNNTINGKPLVYWENMKGGTVPNGAGQIILVNCTYVTITDQILSNSSIGILTVYSSHLTIRNNTLYNSRWGILAATNKTIIHNNTVYDNHLGGLQLWIAYDNIVSNNTVNNNNIYGIILDSTVNNTFSNNTISKTSLNGIRLWGPNNNENKFTHNIIYDNGLYGISIDSGSSNTIVKYNDFIGNNIGRSQANDSGFNNIFENNYWSDWTNPDDNNDDIVDKAYLINGTSYNYDQYPLVMTPSIHYLTLPFVTSPGEGAVLSGNIIISWTTSVDTWEFPVQYFVYYYSIDGDWILLATNLTVTSYTWDTNTVPDGTNYLLKVEAISKGGLNKSSTISFEIDNTPPPPPPLPPTTPTSSTTTTTTRITPGWNILFILPVLFILLSRRHFKKKT